MAKGARRSGNSRTRRIGALLQRELAALIQTGVNDPRVGKVSLTAVDVAPDLSHANIFFTALEGAERGRGMVAALNKAGGFLRRQLAGRTELRTVPVLRFRYDESVERGMALSRLIEQARAQDDGTKNHE